MSIITRDYFIGDISLPQAAGQFTQGGVDNAITRYEPEILKRLLGYNLYKAFNAAWLDSIKDPDPVTLPERFDWIINGQEFSFKYNGSTVDGEWIGLKNDEKESIISYYTYFKYRNNTENHTSSTGEVSIDHVMAEKRSAMAKMVYAWNRMIDLYGATPKPYQMDLSSKKDVRDHFLRLTNYRHYNPHESIYNFLLANKATYPEWVFEPAYKINTLGI